MKRKNSIVLLLLATLLLALAACAEAVPGTEPENGANEAEMEAAEGAAPATEGEGVVKTIYVGPELVDCVGVGPQQCMLVKEDPNAEYQYHYFGIEGFDYEPGYEYELLIRETTVDNPPADGSSLQWTLIEVVSKTPAQTAVAPDTSQPPGRIVTAFVGPELVDCVGVAPQQCLQYKTNPDDDYSLFYDSIDGFNFEPGYEYELSVLVEPVQNPPADASALKYTLVEVISKTPVTAGGEAMTGSSPLEGSAWVLGSYIGADGSMVTALPDIEATASFQDGQVSGMGSCNRYFGSYEVDGNSLSFSPLGSTMMACEPGIMQQEAAFLAAMGNTAAFEISNDQLLLQDANGQTIVIFNSQQTAPATEMPAVTLTEMTWVMTAYLGLEGEQVDALPDTRVTASFVDGQVSGTSGCNRYFGSYETDGSAGLTFGPLGSSMMMCFPEEVMLQETAFLANMSSVAAYEIVNGQLLLQDAEGQTVLVFNGEQPITLTNTTWIVTTYNNGNQAVVGVIEGTEMTAEFTEDGTMSGSAGCNNYRATYEMDGNTMTIGPAAATRKLCASPEGIMEQEALYLAAIANAATFSIEGDTLELRDAEGAKLAGYRAAAAEATVESEVAPAPELAGTAWQWVAMTTPVEQINVSDPTQYVVEFLADGVIGVTADCNTGSGSYEAADGRISINITATTLALCPPESLSDQFIRSLNAAAIYFMQDGNLFIDLFASSGTMEFAPR